MTTPVPGDQGISLRNLANIRLFLYILSPMVVTALVASELLTQTLGGLITGLALAILNPILQTRNSVEKWRTYVYGIGGAINAIALAFGWWTDTDVSAWIGVITMAFNSVLASFFTPTTTDRADRFTASA